MAVPSCSDEKSEPDGELSQSAANTTSSQSARIVVTKDFGATVLEDETLDPMGDITALEALKQVAKVETSYGGGFVNAIDGLCSEYTSGHKNKADWFWYINGMQSKTGAGEYKLRPGDVEHWDFRDWSFHYSVPAIVGHFPEPFLHGYGGKVSSTVVVYQDGFADEAKDLVIRLGELGIAEVISKEVAILTGYEKERSNLIIIGTESCNLISELNSGRLYNRAGFFAQLKDNKITAYDAKGDVSATYGAGCGLIQATQNPWNSKGIGACDNVVWTVAGTDATGVETAVDVLLETPEEFGFACGLIVSEEEVLRVPQ
ncbi:MAG: DUF4430 domain-containing protein [Chloroflexota bacterium]|nr:DUF4430 domain-containing protein [Chloroflexota bacterium]